MILNFDLPCFMISWETEKYRLSLVFFLNIWTGVVIFTWSALWINKNCQNKFKKNKKKETSECVYECVNGCFDHVKDLKLTFIKNCGYFFINFWGATSGGKTLFLCPPKTSQRFSDIFKRDEKEILAWNDGRRCNINKGVLKNFELSTEKHLYRVSF